MSNNPQIAILNSTIRASGDAVNLTRLLVSHYGSLGSADKDKFAAALIMEICSREALRKELGQRLGWPEPADDR